MLLTVIVDINKMCSSTLCLLQRLTDESMPRTNGVVVIGGIGVGKTAIIEQLVDQSPFGDGRCCLLPTDATTG